MWWMAKQLERGLHYGELIIKLIFLNFLFVTYEISSQVDDNGSLCKSDTALFKTF